MARHAKAPTPETTAAFEKHMKDVARHEEPGQGGGEGIWNHYSLRSGNRTKRLAVRC
jgi:hypothetical protein